MREHRIESRARSVTSAFFPLSAPTATFSFLYIYLLFQFSTSRNAAAIIVDTLSLSHYDYYYELLFEPPRYRAFYYPVVSTCI